MSLQWKRHRRIESVDDEDSVELTVSSTKQDFLPRMLVVARP